MVNLHEKVSVRDRQMRLQNGLVAIIFYQCVTGFAYDPFEYTAHEEQYVTNPNDIILLDYNASLPKTTLYELNT
jgi:hypothetical protein